MYLNRIILLSIILCFSFSASTAAKVYKYVDECGKVYYTDSYRKLESYKNRKHSRAYSSSGYDSIISTASKKYNISFALVKAIIKVESNFNPNAVSHKGARGLMQLMPRTSKQLKIKNPFNPHENILGGSSYLKKLMDRYEGNLELALAAYNAGIGTVQKYNGVPPYKETRAYIKNILKYRDIYRDI